MLFSEKIKKIKLLLLDVDGVLTDGSIIIDDKKIETKNFNVKDGHGIKLLNRAGIKVGIITGRVSNVVDLRAKELGIEIIIQGSHNKVDALKEILKKENLKKEEIAYCGDDIIDIPVMKRVGVAFTVSDAHDECKKIADYVTEKKGGEGAVREISELILKVSGKWDSIYERYKY